MSRIQRHFFACIVTSAMIGACSFSPNVPNGHLICQSPSECPSGYTCESVLGADVAFKVCCKDKGCGAKVSTNPPADGSSDLMTPRDGQNLAPETESIPDVPADVRHPDSAEDTFNATPPDSIPPDSATPDSAIPDSATPDTAIPDSTSPGDSFLPKDTQPGPDGPTPDVFIKNDSADVLPGPDTPPDTLVLPDLPPPDLKTPDAQGTCGSDQDCPTTLPMCLKGMCARCATSTDCTGNALGGMCDTSTGRCAACLVDSDCKDASKPLCGQGKCTSCTYATTPNGCCDDTSCTTGGSGTTGKCTIATHACSYTCDSTHKACGTACIPAAGCCVNGDCNGGGPNTTGKCDTSYNCSYTCDSTHKSCTAGGACIPTGACCVNADCDPGHQCNASNACEPLPGCVGNPLLDCACSTSGALACNGAHQALKLKCASGQWTDNGTCQTGLNCEQVSGQCYAIISQCTTKSTYCSDSNTQQTCKADWTSTDSKTCDGVCKSDACQNPYCGDSKVESGETCDDGGTLPSDGCESDCTLSKVIALAAGSGHTCALLGSGDVRCWGDNTSGQLGLANVDLHSTTLPYLLGPVKFGDQATGIAAGLTHTCVKLAGGGVRCWGANDQGQLGQGDVSAYVGPAPLITFSSPVQTIAAGGSDTCVVLLNGEVHCWGGNSGGMLGLGQSGSPSQGTPAVNLGAIAVGGVATAVSVGSNSACAILQSGGVICWGGSNGNGQLGRGDTMVVGDNETPAAAPAPAFPIVPSGMKATMIATGASHTCVRLDNGGLECWGPNTSAQLGLGIAASINPAIGDNEAPATSGVTQLTGVTSVFTGNSNCTCAKLLTGSLRCWGLNTKAELGYNNTANKGGDSASIPTLLPDVSFGSGITATSVALGTAHTCALLSNGQVKCWGRNNLGQLGDGQPLTSPDFVGGDDTHTPNLLSPVQIFNP